MKSKWNLIASVFQLIVGVLAVAAFIILAVNQEDLRRWIVTLFLVICFVVLGIIGILDYIKKQRVTCCSRSPFFIPLWFLKNL